MFSLLISCYVLYRKEKFDIRCNGKEINLFHWNSITARVTIFNQGNGLASFLHGLHIRTTKLETQTPSSECENVPTYLTLATRNFLFIDFFRL